jgi:3-oxoacyl-[acyl-carrier-protein] synthase III
MSTVSLVDVASYLPENKVGVEYFAQYADKEDPLKNSIMFRAPKFRHHVARDETAADMIEKAAATLFERHGTDVGKDVDIVLTNVLLPDVPFTGVGAEIAHRIGARPEWVIDHHNGGCASFIGMLKLAQALISAGDARTALLCNVQNCAGAVFTQTDVRTRSHAAVPGDACGVGLVTASAESPVLGIETRNIGEYAKDVGVRLDDGRKYWEVGESQLDVAFTEDKVANIIARGNRLVPETVGALCKQLGMTSKDIDLLFTNQPNRMFLRNWREALELPQERHPDTYDDYGNLFGAGVPVTLDRELRSGNVKDDSLLVLAGFAHAGDYAAAAAVRWQAA